MTDKRKHKHCNERMETVGSLDGDSWEEPVTDYSLLCHSTDARRSAGRSVSTKPKCGDCADIVCRENRSKKDAPFNPDLDADPDCFIPEITAASSATELEQLRQRLRVAEERAETLRKVLAEVLSVTQDMDRLIGKACPDADMRCDDGGIADRWSAVEDRATALAAGAVPPSTGESYEKAWLRLGFRVEWSERQPRAYEVYRAGAVSTDAKCLVRLRTVGEVDAWIRKQR